MENGTNTPPENRRAWIEIDLNALASNVADIRSKIPKRSEIMAIVKADAYGHGVEGIAGRLTAEGITTFAVSTVLEGVQLRQLVPVAEIIVLGYTHPYNAGLLAENNLIQLVADGTHAKALDETGHKLRVHIAIDTGMHRLGIESSKLSEIERIYHYNNLVVEGVATHLASPDSSTESDIDFTNKQMDVFNTVVRELTKNGYDPGKTHAQSSYGIFNYPDVICDYVRPGIMLFGVHSQNDDTVVKTGLRPVLSLKAKIAQVKWIGTGESVSYGRMFTAEKPVRVATVTIGYADGIPRQVSGKNAEAIVNGQIVPIIGRVCMDMLMLDVTNVEHVKAGDTATFIGKDGDEEIRCEDLAEKAGTITNDVLAGLGKRLFKIYK